MPRHELEVFDARLRKEVREFLARHDTPRSAVRPMAERYVKWVDNDKQACKEYQA